MEDDWVTRWAAQLHQWLEPEEVRKQIKRLVDLGDQYLPQVDKLNTTLQAIERHAQYFGHTTIRDSQLPLVNSDGYFLRGWNDWNRWHNQVAVEPTPAAVTGRLFANASPETLVVIDHVANIHYYGTPRLPRFLPIRRSLEIRQIVIEDSFGWTARLNDHNSVGISGKESRNYVEHWDSANGVEATIREDFILNRLEIEELVRCQFSNIEFSSRFCYLLWAYATFAELASEGGVHPGHSESRRK